MTESVTLRAGRYDRIPYLIMFKDPTPYKDTYAGEMGKTVLKSHLLKPVDCPSDTVVLFMHPIGGGEYLPMPTALAKAGHHVIYCQSRYPSNDTALIMEKVVVDMGACIRDAKERLGYKKVVLAGWSGGGSLSALYQSQAENPTITETPAGEPPNLVDADLIPADGMMFVTGHRGRAHTLTEWLDASILDELDPSKRDPELDIYNPENPNQAPYSVEFLARYRQAQIDRNRRITAWVRAKLAELREAGRPYDEFGFVVHGTMADPKWLDPAIDPNDRKPQWCFLGDPEVVNNSAVGIARFCTLRSWLSQWSYDDTRADGFACARQISKPTLVVNNTGDDAVPPSHAQGYYDAIPHENKRLVHIEGANHYYFGQPELLAQSVAVCSGWLKEQDLA